MINFEYPALIHQKPLRINIHLSVIGIIIILLAGCGDKENNPVGPANQTGTLQIDITTTGQSPDNNGYSVLIDGSNSKTAEAVDVIFFNNIEVGIHTAELTDIQSNCTVTGETSQTVNIAVADTVTVMFDVECKKRLENQIVFISNRSGGGSEDLELFVMNPDGSDPTPLTRNGAINLYPSVSPDGTEVLYSQRPVSDALDYQLRVIDADGTNDRAITPKEGITNSLATWSPDGTQIVFTTNRDGNFEIYTIDTDGSNPVNISRSDSVDQTSSWSPDGSKIAFASNRDGDFEIYVANTDGTGLVQLTDDPGVDIHPAWSPDGRKIAFTSNRDGNANIFVMNADGTGLIKLTNSVADVDPTWSPDGTEIAFASSRDGNAEIYKMRVDGSGFPVNLTAHPDSEDTPAWSSVQE